MTANEIRNKLNTNDRWLTRGILAIYAKQTADEQTNGHTKHHNKQGFNANDAPILSFLARQVLAGRTLSPVQLRVARRRMPKYAAQLARIAQERAKQPA